MKMKTVESGNEVKTVAGNFVYLSILNALNVVLPLIILRYLMRTIGEANYGIYSYVYMILQYVIIFATYGFNFSATKQISQFRDDHARVNAIYNAVIASKLIIGIVLTVVVLLFSGFLFKDEKAPLMFLFGIGMVAGDILTPVWLFQGMEKMKYVTLVNASSKILFTVLVFVFIRKADDYVWLILLNSAGYMLAGVLSLIVARVQFGMKLRPASVESIRYQLKDGLSVFGSTFGMYLYRNANVIILKQFAPNEVVGLYAAAEKVIKGFQSIISPVAQALFPHLSLRFKQKTDMENLSLLRKISIPFAGVVLLLTVAVYIFAPTISDILCGGVEFRDCVPLIRIMTLVIFFGELNYLIGLVGLVNMNRQKQFFHAVLITGIFSVAFMLIFSGRFGAYAASAAMSLSEMLLTVICLITLFQIKRKS